MNINQKLNKITISDLDTNTKRVAYRLLTAKGQWMPKSRIAGRNVRSVASRIRDLRTTKYGGFRVECKTAAELGKAVAKQTYYYRINPNTVTHKQVDAVFDI